MLEYIPFKRLVHDLLITTRGPLKHGLKEWITEEYSKRRLRYIDNISKVKTIWQIDKSVDIESFYFPTTIYINSKCVQVNDLTDLYKNGRCIVVEGIVGQGKSIFLRYMCKVCFQNGQRIPIFIELRHISENKTLFDLIRSAFEDVCISHIPMILEYMLRKGKIVFLLDGFDEITETFRSDTINFIKRYLIKYDRIQVVITSRPNADIQNTSDFALANICILQNQDRLRLISKLVEDKNYIKELNDALQKRNDITSILTTPLQVTLLIITYKSENSIPDNISEFYARLFEILISRHDKSKPGFIRTRKSGVGDKKFERIFENFCFISLNQNLISMSKRDFYNSICEAIILERSGEFDPELLMDDIVNITSLIIPEGTNYTFIHKSICEYYTAQKIANEKDQISKNNFYKAMREKNIPINWFQVLAFLSEIDEYNYKSQLFLPYFAKTFDVTLDPRPVSNPEFTLKWLIKTIGKEARISIYKKQHEYKVSVIPKTKNWFVNVPFLTCINQTFYDFFNDFASENTLIPYEEEIFDNYINLNKEFIYNNTWNSFILFINDYNNSPIRKFYLEIFKLIDELSDREKLTRPFFQMNSHDKYQTIN